MTSLKRRPDGTWLVRSPRGTVTAKTVLLCTNGYTSRLLPAFSDLIVPVRGQVAALIPQHKASGVDPAQLEHSYVFLGNLPGEEVSTRDEYLTQRPLPNGELIFGGGRNSAKGLAVGVWRDDEVEEPVATWLKTHLSPPLDLRPGTGGKRGDAQAQETLDASFEWTGIMGYSRDSHAWVGAVPESLGGGGKEGRALGMRRIHRPRDAYRSIVCQSSCAAYRGRRCCDGRTGHRCSSRVRVDGGEGKPRQADPGDCAGEEQKGLAELFSELGFLASNDR